MKMIPVANSTNVEEYGYIPETNTLRMTFKGGRTYDYHEVTPETYKNLVTSSSVGQFFHYHIKDKFSFTKSSD